MIKVWFRTGENRAIRKNATINKDTGLLDVLHEKQVYSYHIVTRPIITAERRELLWFLPRMSVDNYYVDKDYNKTIGFEEYKKSDGKSGKIDDMPPQTLSDIVDFAMIKALAARAGTQMMWFMLIAGVLAGSGLGFIAHEIFVPCKVASNTVLLTNGATTSTPQSIMTGSTVNTLTPSN